MSLTLFLLEVGSSIVALFKALLYGSLIPIIDNYKKSQKQKVKFFGKL